MKKLIILLCAFISSVLFLTSCEGSNAGGGAPISVANKTIKMYDEDKDLIYEMNFSSNTSAIIFTGFVYGNREVFYSSIKYKKTGHSSATIQIEDSYSILADGSKSTIHDINFSLIFISPNQGTVSGSTRALTFTLF